jgi:hypothetical protein
MTGRTRLPNRRASESFSFERYGLAFQCTFSQLPDGNVGEVFISNHKTGSHADACARDSAIAASLALQYGCPLEALRKALLRDPRGNAATPLGCALDIIAEQGDAS